MSTRNEFVENLKRNIDIWNGEIARMEKKIDEAAADSRAEYRRQLEKARELRDKANEKVREVNNASADQWEDMRGRMEGAMSDIAEGFRKAWSRMG